MHSNLIIDFLVVLLYLPIIYFLATLYLKSKSRLYKKLFLNALTLKILGGLAFASVYEFYYGGGDTLLYWHSSKAFVNLLTTDFVDFWTALISEPDTSIYHLFNQRTGYPFSHYFFRDRNALFMMKALIPFNFLAFNTYFGSTLLISVFTFLGIWKLMLIVIKIFPKVNPGIIVYSFSMPSVVFWGSGILKDTLTLFGLCLMLAAAWRIVIEKKDLVKEIILLLLGAIIVIKLKPYIISVSVPLILLIFGFQNFSSIKSKAFRIIVLPVGLLIIGGTLFLLLNQFKNELGTYGDLDKIAEKAYVASNDLKRNAYQGNSFDIGSFAPTFQGMLSKFPQATLAGLFRPFIWEINNVPMLISGFENLFLICLTVVVVIKHKISLFKRIFQNYFIIFCVTFSVLFAFSIGVSTSNFGSLVRFKIPFLPFYSFALLYLFQLRK